MTYENIEAVPQRCSVKNVLLEISQNSQENTCATVSFLIKSYRTPPVAASENISLLGNDGTITTPNN